MGAPQKIQPTDVNDQSPAEVVEKLKTASTIALDNVRMKEFTTAELKILIGFGDDYN